MWSLQMLLNSVCNCLFISCHCLCQLSSSSSCRWCPGSIKAAAKDCRKKRENAFLFFLIYFPLNSPSVFPAACPPCNLFCCCCCCCGMWDKQSYLPHLQKAAFILEDDWYVSVCLPFGRGALTSALAVASLQSDGLEGHPRRGLHHHFLRVVQQMAALPAMYPKINGFRRRRCGGGGVAATIDNSFCG